jgi:hypothetical protein
MRKWTGLLLAGLLVTMAPGCCMTRALTSDMEKTVKASGQAAPDHPGESVATVAYVTGEALLVPVTCALDTALFPIEIPIALADVAVGPLGRGIR